MSSGAPTVCSVKSIPSENVTLQFESAHSCVLFTVSDSLAGIKSGEAKKPFRVAKLYVQSIDAYGYQRELSVQRTHRYNVSTGETVYYWESHVYCHPGRRNVQEISESQAKHFIAEFLRLAREYPTLLFNAAFWRANEEQTAANVMPRNSGFVHLCEMLHRGADLAHSLP